MAGAIAGGLFLLPLMGVWLALWRYGRSDRQFRRQTIAKTLAIDSAESLNEIALGPDTPADSGLPDE